MPNDRAIQTIDGGYALYGIDVDKEDDVYFPLYRNVFKTDATGKLMWAVTDYDPNGYNLQAGLAETNDGGVLFGSSILDYPNPYIYNIEKISKNGVKLWQANAPGISNDLLSCIVRVASNSYLLGGTTSNNNEEHPLPDIYLAGITNTTGKSAVVSNNIASVKKEVEFSIYPNPVKDKINIQSTNNARYLLQDAYGKTMLSQKINGNGSIDVSHLQPGIYYIVNTETGNS